jgi:hypothetical protein
MRLSVLVCFGADWWFGDRSIGGGVRVLRCADWVPHALHEPEAVDASVLFAWPVADRISWRARTSRFWKIQSCWTHGNRSTNDDVATSWLTSAWDMQKVLASIHCTVLNLAVVVWLCATLLGSSTGRDCRCTIYFHYHQVIQTNSNYHAQVGRQEIKSFS